MGGSLERGGEGHGAKTEESVLGCLLFIFG